MLKILIQNPNEGESAKMTKGDFHPEKCQVKYSDKNNKRNVYEDLKTKKIYLQKRYERVQG